MGSNFIFVVVMVQIDLPFLVPAHLGSPGKRAVKRVCVCVCVMVKSYKQSHMLDFNKKFGSCTRFSLACFKDGMFGG